MYIRNSLMGFVFVLFSVNSYAAVMTQAEVDAFNHGSKVQLTHPIDPNEIETLYIGGGRTESQVKFFGDGVSYSLNNMTMHYKFGKEEEKLTYDDARKRIEGNYQLIPGCRPVKLGGNPYLVDPSKTLYLAYEDAAAVLDASKKHEQGVEAFEIDLFGNVFDFDKLPKNHKVKKIVIEYLGDYHYVRNDLRSLDWAWLANLRKVLTPDGVLYFEMRNKAKLSQLQPKLPEKFTRAQHELLRDAQEGDVFPPISNVVSGEFFRFGSGKTEDQEKHHFSYSNVGGGRGRQSNGIECSYAEIEEVHSIFEAYKKTQVSIKGFLLAKFQESGFTNVEEARGVIVPHLTCFKDVFYIKAQP